MTENVQERETPLASDICNKLICIDIICHGVPSPVVWKKYLKYHEEKIGSPIKRIAFRRKNKGWKLSSLSIIFENGEEYSQTPNEDLYMQAFLKDVCLRLSCYDCKFKTLHRQSDITLADFWGIQHILPEMDDDKGTSLVFVNSKNGKGLFEKIMDKILYAQVNVNEAVKYNPSAIKSVNYNSNREIFFKEKDIMPIDLLIKKYCSSSIFAKIKNSLLSRDIFNYILKFSKILVISKEKAMAEFREKKDCTGCHACSNICPVNVLSMVTDKEGFQYPEIVNKDRCIKCGKCILVCPIKNKKIIDTTPSAFACINKDDYIRNESSSGGMFTLIAEQIIEGGGVVFGAGFNGTFEVEHSYVTSKEELQKFRMSKYVQSKIGDTYRQVREFLESGREVLFTGTPCQISGLKSFLNTPYTMKNMGGGGG